MNTKRFHLGTLVQDGNETGQRCITGPSGVLGPVLGLCTATILFAGCGLRPKPVTGQEVSPVQLPRRLVQKRQSQVGVPEAEPGFTEPAGEILPPGTLSGAYDNVTYNESQIPIIDVSRPPAQDTAPARLIQAPPRQTASRETVRPAVQRRQEPQPLVTEKVDMPRLSQPGMADELVSVNFDGVDIRAVLKTIGEVTGINFIPHESVSGTVTVMSPTPIRLGDIYAFLQSILDVHGYAAIETENIVKVVPKAEAAKSSLQVRVGGDPARIPKNDGIVTQIIPLKYADATEVSRIVEPILSTGAQMAVYSRTNSIMITDTSANIHHIARIVGRLDVDGSREKVLLFPLTHASAQVLSEQITRILDKTRISTAQAGRARAGQATDQGPKVLPDDRTNSLIVVASEQDVATIAELVEQLDIQRPTGTDTVHVVYLKNADANEVAPSLEGALASMKLSGAVEAAQQIQITANESTNSLIIVASPQDFEVISQIIDKLDIVREQVLVEMLILEVTEEALSEIGVDWATLDEAVSDSIRGFGLTNLGPRVNFLNGTLEGLAVGAWRGSGSNVRVGAILQALQKESGVNILSTPHITTSNHRKALIIVGENRPFVTQSRITESANPLTPTVIKTFEYKDVGITLEITPHVSQGGLVRLEVDSEFTKLIEDVTTPSPDTPTTAKRTAQTVVTMGSGTTVVIGGLIRDDTIHVEKKVPLVGDLPLIGALFRSQRDRSQKTNLLIFITPHVMNNQEELLQMTDRKRKQMMPTLERNR